MFSFRFHKTVVLVLVSIAVLILVPATSMASVTTDSANQQENGIAPHWTCIVETMTDLEIDGTVATVDCWVNGDISEATKAKVIAELQVKSGSNWIAYATWTDTQNDYEAYVYETKDVKKGNTYRVKATYTVWEGSVSEELVVFTDEVTA